MTLFCVTIIIIVAMICATSVCPLWLRHDCNQSRKAKAIISELRKENAELRKELSKTYDEWFEDFGERQKEIYAIQDNLYKITEKLNNK